MSESVSDPNRGKNDESITSTYLSQFVISNTQIVWGDIHTTGKAIHSLSSPYGCSFMDAEYKNGVIDGTVLIFNNKGVKVKCLSIVSGKREGVCFEYDDLGNLSLESNCNNDLKEGIEKCYSNGEVSSLINYINGKPIMRIIEKGGFVEELDVFTNALVARSLMNDRYERDGVCFFYSNNVISSFKEYQNGELVRTTHLFKDGKVTIFNEKNSVIYQGGFENSFTKGYPCCGKGEEFSMGKLIYSGEFKDNRRDGVGYFFYDGNKRYYGSWKNHHPNGEGCFYNEIGEVLYKGLWENGYLKVERGKWLDYESGIIEEQMFKQLLKHWDSRENDTRTITVTLNFLRSCCSEFCDTVVTSYSYVAKACRSGWDATSRFCVKYYTISKDYCVNLIQRWR